MSTEHQQYSPQNQSDTITKYAIAHNMEIVATYQDHGRSGLNLAGRDGLSQLLSDVERGLSTFSNLLVYDVSRWGRFQDADEKRVSRIRFETRRYSRALLWRAICE
jgi:DNA invertase Pin-like site-specific DNA recombinase